MTILIYPITMKNRGVYMGSLGKMLLMMGIVLLLIGGILIIGERFGLGKLPGDIFIQKGNFTFFFPIVSTLIISLLLTLILNILKR